MNLHESAGAPQLWRCWATKDELAEEAHQNSEQRFDLECMCEELVSVLLDPVFAVRGTARHVLDFGG